LLDGLFLLSIIQQRLSRSFYKKESGAGIRHQVPVAVHRLWGERKSLDIPTGLDLEPMNWYSIMIKEDKDA